MLIKNQNVAHLMISLIITLISIIHRLETNHIKQIYNGCVRGKIQSDFDIILLSVVRCSNRENSGRKIVAKSSTLRKMVANSSTPEFFINS